MASLYVHVPFCMRKCGYCDFYSTPDLSLIPQWIKGLSREIRFRKQGGDNFYGFPSGQIDTLYFGGGTPSVLGIRDLEAVLGLVFSSCRIADHAEITLEANPGTLSGSYLADLRTLGVNRLSLGIQSLDPAKLEFLTRIHSVGEAKDSVGAAVRAGFDNIGLDLIYGLPGETRDSWERDMAAAADFDPAHLSCYMLTLEKNTPLFDQARQKRFIPCDPDTRASLFLHTSQFLTARGYGHYEISNFSKGKENRSRHNCGYWNMTPYAGLGPSAHSFVPKGAGPATRFWNLPSVRAWAHRLEQGRPCLEEKEVLTPDQQRLERIMLGLRTREGIDVSSYDRDFGDDFCTIFARVIGEIKSLGMGGFVPAEPEQGEPGQLRLGLTPKGWTCLDSIVEAFADNMV